VVCVVRNNVNVFPNAFYFAYEIVQNICVNGTELRSAVLKDVLKVFSVCPLDTNP